MTVKGVEADDVPHVIRGNAWLDVSKSLGCTISKRSLAVAWTPAIDGVWVPRVHANSLHNETVALLTRFLAPTPGSAEAARGPVLSVLKRMVRLAGQYGGSRWSNLDTALSYTGGLRRRYLEAERSLREDGPLSSSDYFLRSFLKGEKRHPDRCAKPRLIFPRSSRYNLELASYLKPFERWLWGNLKSLGSSGVVPSRVVSKGLNGRQVANLIARKMRGLRDCVVVEVDARAFEAHVDRWQLEKEHAIYQAAYPGETRLARLLGKQLSVAGVTTHGLRFGRDGGRSSGDVNTGMGNSLLMLAVVVAVLEVLEVSAFDTLVDGDNALVFLPGAEAVRAVENFAECCLRVSGHEMALGNPVKVLEHVRFGRKAPLMTSKGLVMVRDWKAILSGGASSYKHLRDEIGARRFLHGVALCELSLAAEVPIVGAWAKRLHDCTFTKRSLLFDQLRDYTYLGVDLDNLARVAYVPPSDLSRESFSRAFGVEPDEQKAIERLLSVGSVSLTGWQTYDGRDIVPGDQWR